MCIIFCNVIYEECDCGDESENDNELFPESSHSSEEDIHFSFAAEDSEEENDAEEKEEAE